MTRSDSITLHYWKNVNIVLLIGRLYFMRSPSFSVLVNLQAVGPTWCPVFSDWPILYNRPLIEICKRLTTAALVSTSNWNFGICSRLWAPSYSYYNISVLMTCQSVCGVSYILSDAQLGTILPIQCCRLITECKPVRHGYAFMLIVCGGQVVCYPCVIWLARNDSTLQWFCDFRW